VTGVAASAGALALSLSFATIFLGQFAAALRICVVQALVIALAAVAQGWALHSASLCIAALLIFALNGIALPLALRRVIGRAIVPRSIAWRCGFAASAAAAVVLVAASVAAAMRLTQGEQFELLASGMSILLLGFLLLALRSHPLLPALGLLASQNGMLLAACVIPGLPPSALLLAAIPLVPAIVVASVCLHDGRRPDLASPCA
jgi:hydrogenase-4 component E